MVDFGQLSKQCWQQLQQQVVPFWLKHSPDQLCGGYFDELSATGQPIEGDKHVWLQAQQVEVFARLSRHPDASAAWLQHALHGAAFLQTYAPAPLSADILNRRGRPLRQNANFNTAYTLVSAYAGLYQATKDEHWAALAQEHLGTIPKPEPIESAFLYDHRLRLADAVMALKAQLALYPLLDEVLAKPQLTQCADALLQIFVDKRTDTLLETVLTDGSYLNTPLGRRINVGLTCRAANYLLDYTAINPNRRLSQQGVAWCLYVCEQAWDKTHGGLLPYLDHKQQPLVFEDAAHRKAWVHTEAIRALSKGYQKTRQPNCLKWLQKIADYTLATFPDTRHTGWHLVVDGQQTPMLHAKATTNQNCFSPLECLLESAQLAATLA